MLRHVVPFTNFYNQALQHFLFLMFRIAPSSEMTDRYDKQGNDTLPLDCRLPVHVQSN